MDDKPVIAQKILQNGALHLKFIGSLEEKSTAILSVGVKKLFAEGNLCIILDLSETQNLTAEKLLEMLEELDPILSASGRISVLVPPNDEIVDEIVNLGYSGAIKIRESVVEALETIHAWIAKLPSKDLNQYVEGLKKRLAAIDMENALKITSRHSELLRKINSISELKKDWDNESEKFFPKKSEPKPSGMGMGILDSIMEEDLKEDKAPEATVDGRAQFFDLKVLLTAEKGILKLLVEKGILEGSVVDKLKGPEDAN